MSRGALEAESPMSVKLPKEKLMTVTVDSEAREINT